MDQRILGITDMICGLLGSVRDYWDHWDLVQVNANVVPLALPSDKRQLSDCTECGVCATGMQSAEAPKLLKMFVPNIRSS